MKRRDFLATPAALVLAQAHAQAPTRAGGPPRVGILVTSPPGNLLPYVKIFIDSMRELGWVDGQNIVLDQAFAAEHLMKQPEMRAHAATLIKRNPDVIWVISTATATAAFAETRTVPIVGSAVSNVVENGFVKTLARPGGNFTGIVNIGWELGGKRFQLLHEMMPKLARVGVLFNPKNSNTRDELKLIEEAAARARVAVIPAAMEVAEHVEGAFSQLVQGRAEAVLITHLPVFQNSRKRILQLAAEHRIAAVGHRTFFAEDGAVMAYSSILEEQMRRSAHLVDKILKGTKPGEIPVEQPTRFELVINLKTAKMLGLTIPNSLLIQADRIIQ
jgi:putative ABC transport system substrate-binding protein